MTSKRGTTLNLNLPFWVAVAILVVSGFHILTLPGWLVGIAWVIVIGILSVFLTLVAFFLIMVARGKAHWVRNSK